MDLRRGPQGPALVASGKASHHASCSGASRDSSPVDAGALYLVWSRCRNLRKPLQCLHGPWGTSGVSQVSQSSSLVDACTCNFLQSCSISVTLPFAWIQESVAFRGGFLTRFATRVSHDVYPLGCPTCHRVVSRPWLESRGSAGKLVSLLCTEHLGDSGNGGTTLEFLSPFLWRAPPLEMRRNAGNSFPTTQGKDPSSRGRRQKRGSSGGGWDSRASSQVETDMSGIS